MRRIGFLALALTMLSTGAILGPAAIADGFDLCYGDEGQGGCIPDNKEHTYCFASSFETYENMREAGYYATLNLVDQTTYTRNKVDPCTQLTDVVWIRDPNLGSATRGRYQCQDWNGAGECEWSHVRLNPTLLNDDLNRKKTACHELGHSLGLTHHLPDYNDCMVTDYVSSGHKEYNQHHIDHINSRS